MNEVVKHAEIEIHSDLVQYRLEPSVERPAVLAHYQGCTDCAEALGRIRHHSRNEGVMRLRGHLGVLPATEPTVQGFGNPTMIRARRRR